MALRERISGFRPPAKAKAANPAKADRGNAPKLAALAGLALATPRKKATTTPEVPGLPCGGCGSTRYRKVVDGFIFPDGSRADGWHCGGRECGVKLMVGRIRP